MANKRKTNVEDSVDLLRSPKRQKMIKELSDSEDDCKLLERIINKPRTRKLIITWPDHDIKELLRRIKYDIPANDKLIYKDRLGRIQWENVKFGNYSTEDCQRTWSILLRQVRKHRVLGEIIDDMRNWVSNPKIPNQRQIKTHPDFPKTLPNSFGIYLADKKDELIRENPGFSYQKIVQKGAQLYNMLPTSKRQKYYNLSQKLREDYSTRVKKFYTKHPEYIPFDKKRTILNQVSEFDRPPEMPKTPFCLFFEGKLQNYDPDLSKIEFRQQCREEWNQLDDINKMFWINWALEQFKKYKEQEVNYRKTHPQFKPVETILTKKEQKLKEKQEKPQRPPRSGFHLFRDTLVRDYEFQILPVSQRMSYISTQWHDCPENEKNVYVIRCQQMWEKYCDEVEEYIQQFPEYQRDELRKEALKWHWKHLQKKKEENEKYEKAKKVDEPELPPKTAFDYFVAEYKGESPEEQWEKLSDRKKKHIEKKLNKKKIAYMQLFEKFLMSLNEKELEEYYKKK